MIRWEESPPRAESPRAAAEWRAGLAERRHALLADEPAEPDGPARPAADAADRPRSGDR